MQPPDLEMKGFIEFTGWVYLACGLIYVYKPSTETAMNFPYALIIDCQIE